MSGPTIGSLFSGTGALDLAVQDVLGGHVAWHSEHEPATDKNPRPTQAAARILAHHWPDIPNHGDITTINWGSVEPVNIVAGGSPCQDMSNAGYQAGMRDGTRSGLWSHMHAAITTIRPALVVWENVHAATSVEADSNMGPCPICLANERTAHLRALGRVVGDLSSIGYDTEWVSIRASDAGAPHGRRRVFVLAWPATDTESIRRMWREQPTHPASTPGRPGHTPRTDPDHGDPDRHGRGADILHLPTREPGFPWGPLEPVIRGWGVRLGRPAPAPLETGTTGRPRVTAVFSEWVMGLPEGWVTGVPGLSRGDMLHALGNGVVPAQGALALRILMTRAFGEQVAA